MPKAYPLEFRRDVIAVARRREAPLSQIAKDFVADFIKALEEGIAAQEIDPDHKISIQMTLTFDIQDGLPQKFSKELRRYICRR